MMRDFLTFSMLAFTDGNFDTIQARSLNPLIEYPGI